MAYSDLDIAKNWLSKKNAALVIVLNSVVVYTSDKKGIQPFFDVTVQQGVEDLGGSSIADRVIGKAALLLAAHLGAVSVYAPVASRHAVEAADALGIVLTADRIVPYIINRTKDGMCPMEKAVLSINDPDTAYEILKSKLQDMATKQ